MEHREVQAGSESNGVSLLLVRGRTAAELPSFLDIRGASFKFPPSFYTILRWKGGGNLKLAPRIAADIAIEPLCDLLHF